MGKYMQGSHVLWPLSKTVTYENFVGAQSVKCDMSLFLGSVVGPSTLLGASLTSITTVSGHNLVSISQSVKQTNKQTSTCKVM